MDFNGLINRIGSAEDKEERGKGESFEKEADWGTGGWGRVDEGERRRERERERGRQTDRQAGRQTEDTWTERQKQREADKETETKRGR